MGDILPLKKAQQKAMEEVLDPSEADREAIRKALQKWGFQEEEIEEVLVELELVKKGFILGGGAAHLEDISRLVNRVLIQGAISISLRIFRESEEDGHLRIEVLEVVHPEPKEEKRG